MNYEELLGHLRGEEEQSLGRHILDLAHRAWDTNRPQTTDFYDPYQRQVAQSVLGSIAEVGVLHRGQRQLFLSGREPRRLLRFHSKYWLETG